MKKGILLALMICLSHVCLAQKEGNIWYFGSNAGLDFNVNPPVPITGSINTTEGCATIADPVTGQLLMYTDGVTIWDRNHNPMPGSITTPLNGHFSSTQSAVIVPKPGSNTLYYIFTTTAQLGIIFDPPAMCYSIVDLSLNGGNGNLVSVNNVLIDSTTEKVAVVGNCDKSAYWIMGHRWNCDSFYAFQLTAAGLSAPVKSKTGIVHYDAGSMNALETLGYMKFSPNGKKIGLATFFKLYTVELFDFDFNTGKLSNPITDVMPFTTLGDAPYGCSFSPDNSKFYVSIHCLNGGSKIYQYDMSSGDAVTILASRMVIGIPEAQLGIGALQNGPDGKMYVANLLAGNLGVINNPNAPGLSCNYVPSGQSTLPKMSGLGLPNIVESFLAPTIIDFNPPAVTRICKGDTVWAHQTTPNAFIITPAEGVIINVDSSIFGFAPATTTTYTVISSGSCGSGDTIAFTVSVSDPVADFVFEPDHPSLEDAVITLRNKSSNASMYAWYNDDDLFLSDAVHYQLPNPGEGEFCYKLVARDAYSCADTVRKCVMIAKSGLLFVPNTFSPNGDGRNDIFGIRGISIQLENLSVFNRYGERVFYTTDMDKGWDGRYKAAACDAGTYYYFIRYKNSKGERVVKKGDIILLP